MSEDLKHRLRCQYPVGPLIGGEPEFGWKDYSGPAPEGMMIPSPIMIEAAERIERLEAELQKAKAMPMKYRRMEFNAQLQTENESLQKSMTSAKDIQKMLIAVTRAALYALEDSEEVESPDGTAYVIDSRNYHELSDTLDALEELPDDRPGYTMNAPMKAEWALSKIQDKS
jgi:hypothetical protein